MDEKFKELVASVLHVDVSTLDDNSNSESVSEWDSLVHWDLISEIESAYNIMFTMDEAADFDNLGKIYRVLDGKLRR